MDLRVRLSIVVAMLMLAACSDNATEHHSARANPRIVSDRCADVIAYGARGQTQSSSANHGVGHEVLVSVDSLVAHLPRHSATTVRLAAVRYPALPEATEAGYLRDIAIGRRLLTTSMAADAKACPKSRFVVVGFSEGAQVVHETIAALPATATKPIAAVALLADPVRNPQDPLTLEAYGTGPLDGRGSAGFGTPFAKQIRARVITFCVAEDNVCNAPSGGRVGGISDAHREFYEKASSAKVTGKHLADLVMTS